jgi:hypothetical protein
MTGASVEKSDVTAMRQVMSAKLMTARQLWDAPGGERALDLNRDDLVVLAGHRPVVNRSAQAAP